MRFLPGDRLPSRGAFRAEGVSVRRLDVRGLFRFHEGEFDSNQICAENLVTECQSGKTE